MTTTCPSSPPANFANRERITLSRTLSSAPPITITGPAPKPGTEERLRPPWSVIARKCSPGAPPNRRARAGSRPHQEERVVLTGIDEPVDPLGHVHLEPQVVTHRGIAGFGAIGELRAEGGAVGHQPDSGIGVEPSGGGIAASQRLGSTIG